MKHLIHIIFVLTLSIVPAFAQSTRQEHILSYDKPAYAWEMRLPLGNGRLGMLPDGDVSNESVILNEISLWSGCEYDYSNPKIDPE